jgi:hypothetical protein
MSQSLIFIDALSSACWEKKMRERKPEKQPGAFFPGPEAGYALLVVQHWIFMTVRWQIKGDLRLSL